MKLFKRGEYALRAPMDLGIAPELGRPIIHVRELAAKEKMPIKFWNKFLCSLKAGNVESRGKLGVTRSPSRWLRSMQKHVRSTE